MCLYCLNNLNGINSYAQAFVLSIRNPWLTNIMIGITDVGSPANIAMYCLVLVLVLWLHKKTHHIVQFVGALLVSGIIIEVLKLSVKLARPTGGLIEVSGYSFASGHAAVAIVFFLLIAYSYKSHIKSGFLRTSFIALNCLIAVIVGLSRIYLGVHYATDVIAGFLIGLIVFAVSIIILQAYERKHPVIKSQ